MQEALAPCYSLSAFPTLSCVPRDAASAYFQEEGEALLKVAQCREGRGGELHASQLPSGLGSPS